MTPRWITSPLLIAALFAALVSASPGVRAEPEVANASKHIILFPASAQPVWNWLKRVTAPNDPFVPHRSRWLFERTSTRVTRAPDDIAGTSDLWDATPALTTTRFEFTVGKDTWHVVADPRRKVVLYAEGCCSYSRVVLAAYDVAPPAGLAHTDLGGNVPRSGVRLGDSPNRVFALLGTPVRRLTSAKTTRWAVAYSRPFRGFPERPYDPKGSCVEERTLVFEHDRLVGYEIYSGC